MMPFEYRDIFFKTIKDFEKYMEQKFNGNEYKFYAFKIQNGACYVTVSNDFDNIEENAVEIKVYNFYNLEEANIYFDDIKEILLAETMNYLSNTQINMKYIVDYEAKVSAVFC